MDEVFLSGDETGGHDVLNDINPAAEEHEMCNDTAAEHLSCDEEEHVLSQSFR